MTQVEIFDRWTDTDVPGPSGQGSEREHDGYDVVFDGAKLPAPALTYEVVESDEGGDRLVVLSFPASRVVVGEHPTPPAMPVTQASGRAARTWGGRGGDPRG